VSVQAYYSLAGRDLEHELIPMVRDQLRRAQPRAAASLIPTKEPHCD
jgi:aryl-alcohol dehydrogenase-like predicted oxidoreductase